MQLPAQPAHVADIHSHPSLRAGNVRQAHSPTRWTSLELRTAVFALSASTVHRRTSRVNNAQQGSTMMRQTEPTAPFAGVVV